MSKWVQSLHAGIGGGGREGDEEKKSRRKRKKGSGRGRKKEGKSNPKQPINFEEPGGSFSISTSAELHSILI